MKGCTTHQKASDLMDEPRQKREKTAPKHALNLIFVNYAEIPPKKSIKNQNRGCKNCTTHPKASDLMDDPRKKREKAVPKHALNYIFVNYAEIHPKKNTKNQNRG